MDNLLLICIVGGFGYYFSQQKNKNENRHIDTSYSDMPFIEKPVSLNIYNSKMTEAANDEVFKLSQHNYKESAIPSVSSVLPPIYNSYSSVGIDTNLHNDPSWKQLAQINSINKRSDINTGEQPKLIDRPMFKPILYLDSNELNTKSSKFTVSMNTNKELSLLTGLPIEREHINQVPFFGGNVKQNIEEFTNESLIDKYTGNTSTFFHKEEPLQRFQNTPEHNINGTTKTPNLQDNIDMSRFIPSRFKQNEKPFYEERVQAPISFTADNPITNAQINQVTIDQLRVSNKPQISYKGIVKAGSQPISNRGKIGVISKNSVDTSFELGNNRLFTGPGLHVLPMATPDYTNIQLTDRQSQNIEYYGPKKTQISSTIQRSVLSDYN